MPSISDRLTLRRRSRPERLERGAVDGVERRLHGFSFGKLSRRRAGRGAARRRPVVGQTRPGSRSVSSWSSQLLPSGSLNDAYEA